MFLICFVLSYLFFSQLISPYFTSSHLISIYLILIIAPFFIFTDFTSSYHILPYLIESHLISSYFALSFLALFYFTIAYLSSILRPFLLPSHLFSSDQVSINLFLSSFIRSYRTLSLTISSLLIFFCFIFSYFMLSSLTFTSFIIDIIPNSL